NGALEIAKECFKNLPEFIIKKHSEKKYIKDAIKKGFEKMEQYLKLRLNKESKDAGSTAILVVLIPHILEIPPRFISSNKEFSVQIMKEHDLHNKAEILRLREQKKEKNGVSFSIYRFAPEEKKNLEN
ncbi:10136_t:CDS:2, partial [Cetraspora pellucida]